jgi:hypothetical protein
MVAKLESISGDSAGGLVLVKAQPRGVGLLRHNEPIAHPHARYVLGKTVKRGSKTLQSRL